MFFVAAASERDVVESKNDHSSCKSMQSREADLEDALIRAYAICMASAHELKTPLTIMSGVVSLMKLKYGNDLGDELETMLNKITNEIRRMSSLIDDASSKVGDQVPEDLREKARNFRRR